jgi:hypothetical protein
MNSLSNEPPAKTLGLELDTGHLSSDKDRGWFPL